MLRIKNKTPLLGIIAALALSLGVSIAVPQKVSAVFEEPCPDGYTVRFDNDPNTGIPTYGEACEDHQTGGQASDSTENADASRGANLSGDCSGLTLTKDNCGIVGYIVMFINVLSAAVGVVIVIMIAVGGIQYTTSRDDPQMVNVAKQRIQNAVLALVFYLFAFAFLQWLVPGGIF